MPQSEAYLSFDNIPGEVDVGERGEPRDGGGYESIDLVSYKPQKVTVSVRNSDNLIILNMASYHVENEEKLVHSTFI